MNGKVIGVNMDGCDWSWKKVFASLDTTPVRTLSRDSVFLFHFSCGCNHQFIVFDYEEL